MSTNALSIEPEEPQAIATEPEPQEPQQDPAPSPEPEPQPQPEAESVEVEADDAKGGDAASRIRGLLAENKALREYGGHWREMALSRQIAPQPQAPPQPEPQDEPAPSLADFDSTEKWAAAHAAWTDRRIERRAAALVEQTINSKRDQESQADIAAKYAARMDELEKAEPGARLIVANPTMTAALQRQPVIGEVVMASDVGPQIAVHLSKHPDELVRISRLPPTQAAAAIGRIEAQLASKANAPAPKPAARKPSNAPPPPNPVGSAVPPSADDLSLPLEDFIAKLNRRSR